MKTKHCDNTTKNSSIKEYWHKGGICGLICRAVLRTLQFVFAVIIAALYGVDLSHSTQTHAHAHSEWIYAEVVACLSCITCILHCFLTVTRVGWSAWDGVLFVLWLAQVGVFGSIYVGSTKPGYYDATQSLLRMHIAVWINLVNMLLWFTTTVLGVAWCIRTRRVTGRTVKLEKSMQQVLERGNDVECGVERVESRCIKESDDKGMAPKGAVDNIGKREGYNEDKKRKEDC